VSEETDMSRKTGYWQKVRADNLMAIVKLVAVTMPKGVPDDKLRACIQYNFGASKRAVDDYLETLVNSNKIEKTEEGVWTIV
jgi:hypothetical protein